MKTFAILLLFCASVYGADTITTNIVGDITTKISERSGPEGIQSEAKDATEVRRRLDGYSKGRLTLEEVSDGEEWGGKVIAYYLTHGNEVSAKMKLPVARCYLNFSGFTNAAQLATDYLGVYTNDARAWDLLACAKYKLKSFEDGFAAGTNALRLGCERNIAATGGVAIQLDRLDVLENMIVPRLLLLKGAKETSIAEKRAMLTVLVVYSLQSERKDVFLKALEGADPATVISDVKLMGFVEMGLEQFGPVDTEKIRNKIFPTKGDDK